MYPQTVDEVLENIDKINNKSSEYEARDNVGAYIKWVRSEELTTWNKLKLKRVMEILNGE